jgi:hypothetical protein
MKYLIRKTSMEASAERYRENYHRLSGKVSRLGHLDAWAGLQLMTYATGYLRICGPEHAGKFYRAGMEVPPIEYIFGEHLWLSAGKPCIFIENIDLENALAASTADVDFSVFRSIPSPIYISIQAEPGNRLREPFLAFRLGPKQSGDLARFLAQANKSLSEAGAVSFDLRENETLYLMARDPTTPDMPLKEMGDLRDIGLEPEGSAVAWTKIPENDVRPATGRILPAHEETVMARCSKLFIGLAAYIKAYPTCLVDGLPEGMKFSERPIGGGAKIRKIVLLDRLKKRPGSIPSAHWRRWHFRTLRDERYKREPDGSCRVIMVKESLVNARTSKVAIEREAHAIAANAT